MSNAPPTWLPALAGLEASAPTRPGYIVLAQLGGRDAERYQHRYTGLIDPELLARILEHPGGIGNRVEANGPGPSPPRGGERGSYRPRFRISAPHEVEIEPLVEVWEEHNRTVLHPNSGLLMTYGLVPRHVTTSLGEATHWDDLDRPITSVIVVESPSRYSFPEHSPARVEIRGEYLEDYATLRGKSVVETSFVEVAAPATPEETALLDGESVMKWEVPGKSLYLRKHHTRTDFVIAQADNSRLILSPGEAPVSAGRWDYGELIWPGHSGPITKYTDFASHPIEIFVRDSVLREFEGRDGFELSPTIGGVSYGNQWSTGNTRRIGRNFIGIELKKLYEGTPPDVVRLVHAHAVKLSDAEVRALADQPNIAIRTERILKVQLRLAAAVQILMTDITGAAPSMVDLVDLDPDELDYRGWWANPLLERVSRQAAQDITRDAFLARCVDLDQLVAESWNQRELRHFLIELGDDTEEIKSLRSIGLLKRLVDLAAVSHMTGLRLKKDHGEIRKRLRADEPSRLRITQGLNALRNARSHKNERSSRVRDAYKQMGLPLSPGAEWGTALDDLYDALTSELKVAAATLERAN